MNRSELCAVEEQSAKIMELRAKLSQADVENDELRREARLSNRIANWPVAERICHRLYEEGGYEVEPGKTVLPWDSADKNLYEQIIIGELLAETKPLLVEIKRLRKLEGTDDHPEHRCDRCGGRNLNSWYADSDVWNRVAGDYSILCPICFAELAAGAGIKPTAWRLSLVGDDPQISKLNTKLHKQLEQLADDYNEIGRLREKRREECTQLAEIIGVNDSRDTGVVLADVAEKFNRLQAKLDKLPKTANDVSVFIDDVVWSVDLPWVGGGERGRITERIVMHCRSGWLCRSVKKLEPYYWPVKNCYSTYEVANEAREKEGQIVETYGDEIKRLRTQQGEG